MCVNVHVCYQQMGQEWLCVLQVVSPLSRYSSLSLSIQVPGRNKIWGQLPRHLIPNSMDSMLLPCQYLIFYHSNSRPLFSLCPCSKHFNSKDTRNIPNPMILRSGRGDHQLYLPGDQNVAESPLKQGKNFLKETLVASNLATERSPKWRRSHITTKGSFISLIQWSKTWTKKLIIQTRCWFCNIHFNDELFQFSFISNM